MTFSFDKFGFGYDSWTIDDEKITCKGKDYDLKNISRMFFKDCKENPGPLDRPVGTFTIYFEGVSNVVLAFLPHQREQAREVYHLLEEYAAGKKFQPLKRQPA